MAKELEATIYHNPNCGTSRNVLKILNDAGYKVTIIEYLETGWTKESLIQLLNEADLTPRSALRINKTPAAELGLTNTDTSENQILESMIAHPILVNRPIVKTSIGVKLCRPSETVLAILTTWPKGPYYKEDGEMILDEQGRLVQQEQ